MESKLKVPYGLDTSGQLVSADLAEKDKTYFCPNCNSQLVRRAGEVKVKHFAHPSTANCSQESILHITAKNLIESVIRSNSLSQIEITLHSDCYQCGVEFNTTLPFGTFTSAAQEVTVASYVCDVVGYRIGGNSLGIEIFHTHEVDGEKAANLPIPWIELKAEDVINDPHHWKPTQRKLKPSFCSKCRSNIKLVQSVANRWNIDSTLYTPIKNAFLANYVADVETCFRCKEVVPVFWWMGVPFCEQEPPHPRPKTIKYRNSKKYGGSYWANTCANCNMIQGDNYLFLFDDAPFKNMPVSESEREQDGGLVKVATGDEAISEMMKVIKRNFS
ncbi:competence CoiA-like family protein [Alteromonas pelagimontana]|uniref:Competence CoiA-like family protein n=1 Tax=Alteromonas pelagimontana TaxID=1858656 RepID=A0A6M4M8S7_9ALTE|nr:competence protein CoiA family protein [Alteromonas pelagimontana]QJR79563.1 competence CoiA-like family protein [Alteromonas pelagimontana]